jgi:glutathione S-transferase
MNRRRLSYFNLRGRAEAIRLFHYATGTEFDDHRVASAAEWDVSKRALPFGALPIYESDGLRMSQSHAILRHLGRTLSPGTRSEIEFTQLDATQEAFAEAQEDYWRFAWIENYYDHLEKYADETLAPRLRYLLEWFTRNGAGAAWWVGDALSYVDCVAFVYLDEVEAFFPAVLEAFSALSDFHFRFTSQPGIADYLVSPQRPAVFGMGSMGPKIDPRVSLQPGQTFVSPWAPPLPLDAFLPNQRRLVSWSPS